MDQQPPNDNQLSSYYHPHQHHQSPAAASPTNGLLPASSAEMVYPHSAPSAAVSAPLEPPKRKRGRPRKYGTPEQALAAKKATASSHKERKEQQQQHGFGGSSSSPPSSSYSGPSSRKSPLSNLGNTGQGFTPHVITVAAGEDIAQKIMLFMQQSKREICILSASGSVSSVSLRQPATSGGNVTYEFEIVTLSGSYVRTDLGGRTGGLSICLSDIIGQVIGGGVGGPLVAGGPVQVIIGSFSVDPKKDTSTAARGDPSGKSPAAPSGGFRAAGIDSSSPSPYITQSGTRM
ncbi:AT-hook motif nuclear-localized protein 14-like isoform X2 [Punica granatum]|uniref:AT-hook motif nuclear-localized protein n=1 Tax=Punica granatum TaxID=22663 RepID=A0A6P8CRX6_PUNGR|nr:AT-hook motif nuclear-localized protein 14-like isoform X2 [Punica granatum]